MLSGDKRRRIELNDELSSEFAPALPVFEKKELEAFGEWLEQFKEEKTLPTLDRKGTEVLRVLNYKEAAVAFGALKKSTHHGLPYYAVILKPIGTDRNGNANRYETPTMIQRFNDKMEQYSNMMYRRAYAESKRMLEYSEIADGLDYSIPA